MALSTSPAVRVVLLITAILIWINVYALSYQTKVWAAPIVVSHLAPGLAVVNAVTTVEAKISGRPSALKKLTDTVFNFELDLTKVIAPGRYSLALIPSDLPADVQLIGYSPEEIVVDIDVEVSKVVPVVLDTQGWVADDYSIKQTRVVPDHVTIYGAAVLLDRITQASANVKVARRRETFVAPVNFLVESGSGSPLGAVRISPPDGKAEVEIGAGAAVRNLGIKPSFSGELPGGFWVREVKFEPGVVLVSGTQQALDQLANLTSTPIQLGGHTSSFTDQVAVDLPSGVTLVGENLILATVAIESSQGTKQFTLVPQYINVTEGFSVTAASPASVRVVLAGAPETLKDLQRNDVVLHLNLQGALSGANMITIDQGMFTTPRGVEVVSFAPERLEVILSRSQ